MSDAQPVVVAVPAVPVRRAPTALAGVIWLVGLIVLTFVAMGVGVAIAPQLLSGRSLGFGLDLALPLAAMAVIATLLLALGAVDLSIGSLMALTSVTIGLLAPELGVGVAAAVAVLMSVVVGLINGLVTGITRIHSAIVTLGALALLRGIAYALSGNEMLRVEDAAGLNSGILNWVTLILALVLTVGLAFGLSRSRSRDLAQGSDDTGIARVLWLVVLFTLSGLFSGLAGVSLTGRLGVGSMTLGTGYETIVIGVALLGGVALGRGVSSQTPLAIVGTLVAVAAFSIVNSALLVVGSSGTILEVLKGALILAGVIASSAYHWIWDRIAAPRIVVRS